MFEQQKEDVIFLEAPATQTKFEISLDFESDPRLYGCKCHGKEVIIIPQLLPKGAWTSILHLFQLMA